jgi:hypothetical protein
MFEIEIIVYDQNNNDVSLPANISLHGWWRNKGCGPEEQKQSSIENQKDISHQY